jgi:hypothetical protein
VEQLPEFEEGMAAALAGTRASALCQYDRERFDPVTLATVAPFHTRSVAAATYYADALLRICRQYAPPGIRLDGDITINLADLTFIDGPCARMILNAARGLASSRRVADKQLRGAGR